MPWREELRVKIFLFSLFECMHFANSRPNTREERKVLRSLYIQEIYMIEKWDKSREKAKELRLEQWGTPEEVKAMSAPLRQASNRRTAMDYLKEIAFHSPFTSRSGLSARLPNRSLGKIVSHAAVVSSFCQEAHYLAAANIDKLYTNAIEPWEFDLNPNKDNAGLKTRRYLYAPMEYEGKITIVKITVKEYEDANLQNNLYSIAAIDVELRV
jgi:hypothetical protein